jgi:3-keto-L-gulonate-6-phosphate decarboxylase
MHDVAFQKIVPKSLIADMKTMDAGRAEMETAKAGRHCCCDINAGSTI